MYWRVVGAGFKEGRGDGSACGTAPGTRLVILLFDSTARGAQAMTAVAPTFTGDKCLFCAWVVLPTRRLRLLLMPRRAWVLFAVCVLGALTPVWLPWLGSALVVDDPITPSDAALVMEGTGTDAMDAAENWRQAGLIREVVIVEAPIKTHALVTYWSDLVADGIARPSPTPPEYLSVVRAPSTNSSEQARAALPTLQSEAVHSVLVPGGGGIGTRVVERDLHSVFEGFGISVHLVGAGPPNRSPASWYRNADDRRAVLDSWLQLLVPYLGS